MVIIDEENIRVTVEGIRATVSFDIDFDEVEANQLGEFLRRITFIGYGLGCYDTFEVRTDANRWTPEQLTAALTGQVDPVDLDIFVVSEMAQGYTYKLGELFIDVLWFWDGDGFLNFTIRRDNAVIRVISNSDCKKSNCWGDFD